MSKYGEPWFEGGWSWPAESINTGAGGEYVATCNDPHERARIVACVNALAGIEGRPEDVRALLLKLKHWQECKTPQNLKNVKHALSKLKIEE
jgi:hypothetical protein